MFPWFLHKAPMKPRSKRWLAAAVCTVAVCAAALLAQPTTTIRVNVDLVHAIATVKNQSGQLVASLQKEDFEVYDNGSHQEIAVFERTTAQPLSVALLVDISGSTAKELKYEGESASRFLRALLTEGNPDDVVSLYTFNYEVRQVKNFTHNYKSLEDRLKLLHGEAGTALYDAIYLAARDLEPRDGRKVIVVVTDGGDTFSKASLHEALDQAQLANAVIYPIVVLPITNDAGRNVGGENALKYIADGTGGRSQYPALGAELDRAFTDIVSELRTQYLLGFYPQNVPLTKSRFHKLEIRVKRPELRVSARNGYYGDSEGSSGAAGARTSVTPERKSKPHER
jgi:Ca-activated chloride channel family protein